MDYSLILNSLRSGKRELAEKILAGQRVTPEEGIKLYEEFDLGILGILADKVRENINNDYVYFNRNVHLEPTNICIHNCLFCSYSRKVKQEGAWEYSLAEIRDITRSFGKKNITEIHIVGGVHPSWDLEYYSKMLKTVRKELPEIHIKAFTAAEIEHMAKKSGVSVEDTLKKLVSSGLNSMPGGGAEIFDEELRKKICPDKTDSKNWLNIHKQAHEQSISTNCTMLYGHLETYSNRIDHLERLRILQDETGGFNAFIPLKYKSGNNELSETGEVSPAEDLKNYAVSRIYLDNIPHVKSYWPMTGKDLAAISLSFGVDDLDGTIEDTTKIYSMAGAKDQNPEMTIDEILSLVTRAGKTAVERDSLYNPLKIYKG